MGLFDKMFGRGASEAQQQPNAEQRFNTLKQKYTSVLNAADQERIQFVNLHVQDNKLYIKAIAPSEGAKNKFWDQINLVNPRADDITADISVDTSRARPATAKGGCRRVTAVHARWVAAVAALPSCGTPAPTLRNGAACRTPR